MAETAQRESEAAAETLLESMAEDVEAVTGERPELLREGERSRVLSELLCEDPEISLLILSASRSSEGPVPGVRPGAWQGAVL